MPAKEKEKEAKPAVEVKTEATFSERVGIPAVLFVLAAATSPISQLTLAPVYGAIPSAINHIIAITFACAIGYGSWILDGCPRRSQHIWITIFPFWVPVLQYVLLPYSKNFGPVTGTMLNGAVSCHTLLVPAIYALAEALAIFDMSAYVGPRVGDTIKAAMLIPAFLGMEKKMVSWITTLLSTSKTLSPVHLQLLLASAYSVYFPSWYVVFGLPGLIHTLLYNPHLTPGMAHTALEAHNWTLIDRQWSITGYISVMDSVHDQYRVLRCDHSLLGGEWLATEERKKKEGWKVNEPIYSAFEMLEAVRLMQVKREVQDHEAQALVIGLGIGTAPKALVAHGINTTVIELDPVVHEFATKYFDLPQNHTAVLQDATSWVAAAASQGEQKYDYIIHDVFTGGAEPLQLFNAHFLRDLRSLLQPRGRIALNYAGDLANPLTRNVLHTIEHVFAGRNQCKIFRDGPPERHSATDDEDFLNMVVFCRNELDIDDSDTPFFRPPRQADFLDSKSREHYLVPKPEHEISFPEPGGGEGRQTPAPKSVWPPPSLLAPLRALRDGSWSADEGVEVPTEQSHAPYTYAELEVLERGEEGRFAKQQEESAIRHWYIMRTVLPDAVWELW